MRIIAGTHKRRLITPPKSLPVRPTTDMAKESLFNILRNLVAFENTEALDLFSGTGSIAFEFISRGCPSVVAVDQNKYCTEWIRKAAANFEMKNLKVISADTFRYLSRGNYSFDLIFADPPYKLDRFEEIHALIFKNNLLKTDGWLVIEHPAHIDFSHHNYFVEHRRYGKVNFSFFHYLPDDKSSLT
jgi:16S rRNA (guanine966-N2)-methyltransferase